MMKKDSVLNQGLVLKTIDVFKLAGEDSSIATKIVKETLKLVQQ